MRLNPETNVVGDVNTIIDQARRDAPRHWAALPSGTPLPIFHDPQPETKKVEFALGHRCPMACQAVCKQGWSAGHCDRRLVCAHAGCLSVWGLEIARTFGSCLGTSSKCLIFRCHVQRSCTKGRDPRCTECTLGVYIHKWFLCVIRAPAFLIIRTSSSVGPCKSLVWTYPLWPWQYEGLSPLSSYTQHPLGKSIYSFRTNNQFKKVLNFFGFAFIWHGTTMSLGSRLITNALRHIFAI